MNSSGAAGARIDGPGSDGLLAVGRFFRRWDETADPSPQVFGDQTDVPESGDWWDASYLMMWGSNVPVTRIRTHMDDRGSLSRHLSRLGEPGLRRQHEVRRRVAAGAGRHRRCTCDGDGARRSQEYLVDRDVPFFRDYLRSYTDLPFLVRLDERDGAYVPGKFLTAADLGDSSEGAAWKTVLLDEATAEAVVPNGSMGFRYTDSGVGKWNLDLNGVRPALTLLDAAEAYGVEVLLPCFEAPDGTRSVLRRGVPARRVHGHLVTTVFDLMLAQYGVGRTGLPGDWARDYDDAATPYTPAWQAEITSVPAQACTRIAREFATNAEESGGRSVIIMGAGICQWFHGDATYRAILALLMLTCSMGRNGGGWAHYVGQEKCRPITGWISLANALDWSRPPRTMIGTAYWYMHTDQYRFDGYRADALASPLAEGHLTGMHTADVIAQSARLGWMPFYPQFDRNPLDLADEAIAATEAGAAADPIGYVVDELTNGHLRFAAEDVDAPENWPRTLVLWRANLLGASAKGNEYSSNTCWGRTRT